MAKDEKYYSGGSKKGGDRPWVLLLVQTESGRLQTYWKPRGRGLGVRRGDLRRALRRKGKSELAGKGRRPGVIRQSSTRKGRRPRPDGAGAGPDREGKGMGSTNLEKGVIVAGGPKGPLP